MQITYAEKIRVSIFYEELRCGDTFYDNADHLNIKVNEDMSIWADDFDGWGTTMREGNEIVYPVKTILTVTEEP